jgi:uncharacterized repeat protein (TIGR01451 family)
MTLARAGYHRRLLTRGLVAASALLVLAATSAIADPPDPGVTPATVEQTLPAGGSIDVPKTVTTSAISPNPDIVFLADTTGSMGSAISNVKSNINASGSGIIDTVRAQQDSAAFGVAQYKDFNCDTYPYTLDAAVGSSTEAVVAAVNGWSASGGCDNPEAQLNALYRLATDTNVGWRSGSSRIIVWFGDAEGHDPSDGHSLSDVTTALEAAGIRVLAIDVGALDSTGQATAIANATGGLVLPASGNVSGAILSGLQSIDATVTPQTAEGCDPDLSFSWDPESETVPSGQTVNFTETIAVNEGATPGATLQCDVEFLVNGGSTVAFTESNTVHVEQAFGADLSITKTDEPDPVTAGNPLRYTLTVENLSEIDATGVGVSDQLPAGTTFVGASGSGWSCAFSEGGITCSRPTLAAETTAPPITVDVTAPSSAGTISNSASVFSNDPDPNEGNNTDTGSTTVVARSVPDQGTAFCVSGCTVTTNTGAGATPTDPVVTTLTVPNTANPQTVTITEAAASTQPTFCGGRTCDGQLVTFNDISGVTNRRKPIVAKLTFDKTVRDGLLVYVSKPGFTRPHLVLPCLINNVAFPHPCLDTITTLSNGDRVFTVLYLSGDPITGKR